MFKRLLAAAVSVMVLTACQDNGAAGGGAGAGAAADANYFDGKTVTYIIATDPGGGYDTYGRIIARYMEKHLPGSRFIIRNVPGAGHIVGANTIYASRPDGLTVGMFNTGLIYNQLLNLEGVRFDLSKMSWVGKASNEIRVMIIATNSPYHSFEDMLHATEPVKFAASGVGSAAYLDTRILDTVFPEFDIETIAGFAGAEGELSMMRGEVVAQVGIESSYEQFVANGHAFYALAMSHLAAETLPGVPLADDYATTEQGHQLLRLLEALSDTGRLTVGPPDIPPDILNLLRRAHDAAMEDPDLLAEAMQIDIPINPGTGEFVEQRIKEALDQTPETIALLEEAATSQ
jgi:tripartite-type tricarboxylate transporter receptor subunit TctC